MSTGGAGKRRSSRRGKRGLEAGEGEEVEYTFTMDEVLTAAAGARGGRNDDAMALLAASGSDDGEARMRKSITVKVCVRVVAVL